jgi:hypothetical protein
MDLHELARVVPKHVCDWEVADVAHWLEYVSLPHLAKYFSKAIPIKPHLRSKDGSFCS